jgi:hypothetical protein
MDSIQKIIYENYQIWWKKQLTHRSKHINKMQAQDTW